jgi:hypothetical protein
MSIATYSDSPRSPSTAGCPPGELPNSVGTPSRAARHEVRDDGRQIGMREQHLHREAPADRDDEREDERLEPADAEVREREQGQHVERGDGDAREERKAEQELESDRRPDDLGQVAGDDRELAQDPQWPHEHARIEVATGLREVAAGHDAEAGGQRLEQHRHEAAHDQHPDELVAEPGAAREVGGPVARIHVAHAHEIGRAGEREHALEPARGARAGRGCPESDARAGPPSGGSCSGRARRAHGR